MLKKFEYGECLMEIEKIGKTLEIAKEKQYVLSINGDSYCVMCTPTDLESLVLGFIITEGFADNIEKIKRLKLNSNELIVEVDCESSNACDLKVHSRIKYSIEELRQSLGYLDIEEYRRTRGYHVACIVNKNGLIKRAYDVSRHNAVNKVIGMCLKEKIDFSEVFLLISGRISSSMALKCVRAKIPLIVSKAAIFDSAIEVCKKTGLSAVSFATNIVVKGDALE